MDFEYLNKDVKFDITIVKQIIDGVERKIKDNVPLLHNLIAKDNKTFYESYSFTSLLPTIDRARNEEWIMEKNCKDYIYYGVGNIGIFASCSPEIVLYMAIKALKTGNNIVFFDEEIKESSKYIIDIVNEECERNNYQSTIKIEELDSVSDFCNCTDKFNLILFINQYDLYLDFIAKNQKNLQILCSNYGSMDLYMDDNSLKDTLLKIDNYVYSNNINLDVHEDESVVKVVNNINMKKNNYCSVIFTKDKDKALYFIKNVKSEKVYINRSPIEEYKFEIEDCKFVNMKKIMM